MLSFRKGSHNRNEIFKKSIASLFENTEGEYELILIDNTQNNRGFGGGRNFGASMATGEYIVFVDDDIEFKNGWLPECLKMIELGDKFIATPIHQIRRRRTEMEPFMGYRRNSRVGSNCMVMRMSAYKDIGQFDNISVPKDGMRYADRTIRAGYSFLITKEALAKDMAFNLHSYES